MNMMGSSIKLPLTEKHAGRACTYIKKLTNFQNKNSYNFQISKKKKKIRNREILLPTIQLKIKLKMAE